MKRLNPECRAAHIANFNNLQTGALQKLSQARFIENKKMAGDMVAAPITAAENAAVFPVGAGRFDKKISAIFEQQFQPLHDANGILQMFDYLIQGNHAKAFRCFERFGWTNQRLKSFFGERRYDFLDRKS